MPFLVVDPDQGARAVAKALLHLSVGEPDGLDLLPVGSEDEAVPVV
jgi:hypothetical protein